MNEKVFKALNDQITHEFFSSNLYLSIASYFENIPLDGFSKWFKKQAEEEREHGLKIYEYLLTRVVSKKQMLNSTILQSAQNSTINAAYTLIASIICFIGIFSFIA